MPQQTEGRMRGFQLWINLPSKEKMKPAGYRDIPAGEIPVVRLQGGGQVKVIAGAFGDTRGPVNGNGVRLSTDPLYLDVHLPGAAEFVAPLTSGQAKPLPHRAAGVLSDGGEVRVKASADGVRFLLLAARPLHEPVVQYGPFVMNTREEIEQALADYRGGRLTATA